MSDLTPPQAKVLILAATTGLRRAENGDKRYPPYPRPCITNLQNKGLLDQDWKITARGRSWVDNYLTQANERLKEPAC